MRIITLLLCLIPFTILAQKTPIGILVKFDSAATFTDQAQLGNKIEGLKPLLQEHLLSGFEVTLFEGDSEYSEEAYLDMRLQLEQSEHVVYTSTIYKTETGAIAADLQELYFKLKSGESLIDMEYFNHLPSTDRGLRLNSYANFPLWQIEKHHYLKDVYVATYTKKNADIRAHQVEMMATGKFEFVSVNTLHTVLATVDDPYFENQWALENNGTAIHFDGTAGADMSVPEAWAISTGESVKVAVLDSGTDTNHVDLVGNLLPGYDATGAGTNGYPNTTYSNDGHGTCTAGIVAAKGDNGEGIAGVAYNANVIPVRIFYYVSFGGDVIPFASSEAGTDGIIWAVNIAKADILSNSWGLRTSDIELLGIDTALSNLTIRETMSSGRDGKGVPMLFSSGNEGDDFSIWPASLKETISVGASTMCDELKTPTDCSPEGWWGSNYGDNLDVTAPGVKVLSTDMTGSLGYNSFADNNYSMFNGTSAACPNAAGVMALILAVNPSLMGTDARAILAVTADKTGGYAYDLPADHGLWSEEMGYGRVNAFAAVNYAASFSEIQPIELSNQAFIAYSNQVTKLVLNGLDCDEVIIYNLLGQDLAHLNEADFAEGSVSLSNYVQTNGLYLIVLRQGGLSQTLKAIITQ